MIFIEGVPKKKGEVGKRLMALDVSNQKENRPPLKACIKPKALYSVYIHHVYNASEWYSKHKHCVVIENSFKLNYESIIRLKAIIFVSFFVIPSVTNIFSCCSDVKRNYFILFIS